MEREREIWRETERDRERERGGEREREIDIYIDIMNSVWSRVNKRTNIGTHRIYTMFVYTHTHTYSASSYTSNFIPFGSISTRIFRCLKVHSYKHSVKPSNDTQTSIHKLQHKPNIHPWVEFVLPVGVRNDPNPPKRLQAKNLSFCLVVWASLASQMA